MASPSSAQPTLGPTIPYRLVKYTLVAPAAATAAGQGQREATWSYPVVGGAQSGRFKALNGWLRQQSIEPLKHCSAIPQEQLLRLTDRQLVQTLGSAPEFLDCAVIESSIDVEPIAFGRFISFRLYTEWLGLAHMFHYLGFLHFDLSSEKEADLSTLFKAGALEELNEVVAETIAKTRPLCSGRDFKWHQVSLQPPDRLFIVFTFESAKLQDCGDGSEQKSGRAVSRLIRNPADLRPTRKMIEIRP